MAIDCPACDGRSTLHIRLAIELPADSRSDEITLQIVSCSACEFAGLAVYEESRRGALDGESVDHAAYRVDQAVLDRLHALINRCPARRNAHCPCPTHQQLGASDRGGRWQGPEAIVGQGAIGRRYNLT